MLTWEPKGHDCYRVCISDMLSLWVMSMAQSDGTQAWRWNAYTIADHAAQGRAPSIEAAKAEAVNFAHAYIGAALQLVQDLQIQ